MGLDEKVYDIAMAYILRGLNRRKDWVCTVLGKVHPALIGKLPLQDEEKVLVSAFSSDENWYAFTTRRIISRFEGRFWSLDPSRGFTYDFGNFKGCGPEPEDFSLPEPYVVKREVATITACDSSEMVRFEFETWEESSLPLTALQYWRVKHPVLHKLMTTAEHARWKQVNPRGVRLGRPLHKSRQSETW